MPTNYDREDCRSHSAAPRFGACDDDGDTPAYLDETDSGKWRCTFINDNQKSCTFTAVDNCVEVLRPDRSSERRCDGILQYDQTIMFVELKYVRSKGWIPDGIEQLEGTVRDYFTGVDRQDFTRRLAVLANGKKPAFRSSHKVQMQQFYQRHGVRLLIQAEVRIE